MSSLIEQAAQRLEQLRRAGVTVPEAAGAQPRQAVEAAVADVALDGASRDPRGTTKAPAAVSRRVELKLDLLEASGIVTPNAPRSFIADEYRVIKRPLISNAMGRGAAALKHGNLIMITSAVTGEGKSFTSVNLAMSIAAELDHTVMLVDADVARPSIPRMLGLAEGPGLLDLLEGKAEMSDVLMKTSIDKLTLLTSGTPHARATELLASDAMRMLLDDISQRYRDRIVIFDSPPLLLTTEARVLASQMGQVVMVVQADKTLQADVQQALATIEACPVKMMLLNQVRIDAKGSYGYAHGYGYRQGSGSNKQAA
jgi:protein-tyrosine kinase